MELTGIVMAAGQGSRFGANKLMENFCGKPLCRWVLDALPRRCFSRIVVVTAYDAVAAQAEGFPVIRNDCPAQGISRTIRLGLEAVGKCGGAMFLPADQPLLRRESIGALVSAFQAEPTCIHAVCCDGRRGSPVVFPWEFFPELAALQGDCGGAAVIRRHMERLRLLEVEAWELCDCDTPDALAELERKAVGFAGKIFEKTGEKP